MVIIAQLNMIEWGGGSAEATLLVVAFLPQKLALLAITKFIYDYRKLLINVPSCRQCEIFVLVTT